MYILVKSDNVGGWAKYLGWSWNTARAESTQPNPNQKYVTVAFTTKPRSWPPSMPHVQKQIPQTSPLLHVTTRIRARNHTTHAHVGPKQWHGRFCKLHWLNKNTVFDLLKKPLHFPPHIYPSPYPFPILISQKRHLR